MSRVKRGFGEWPAGGEIVTVRGPHNRTSDKWTIDMIHSILALYWERDGDRARRELAALRQALDFIAGQLGLEATG